MINRQRLFALINSSHPVPSAAVSLFALLFAIGLDLGAQRILLVGLAVLAQQFSVGLSNDWLDYEKDKLVARTDKPAASGDVSPILVRNAAFAAAIVALVLAAVMGLATLMVMILMLIIGWSYNLGLKSTALSVLPYVLGFGILPVFVAQSANPPSLPAGYVVLVAALLGIAAHFANVLPDLIADNQTGVRALPHLLGKKTAAVIIAATAISASVILVSFSEDLNPVLAVIGLLLTLLLALGASVLSLRTKPPRIIFPMLILASLINVVLLVFS